MAISRATAPSTNASVASTPSTVKLSATASTAPLRVSRETSSPCLTRTDVSAGVALCAVASGVAGTSGLFSQAVRSAIAVRASAAVRVLMKRPREPSGWWGP